MRISLVSTGEEILRGEVLDTNAAFASALLDERGFEPGRRYTCGDAIEELEATLRAALDEADAVVCCGGLGPTVDDRTAEAAARVLGRALVEDPRLADELRQRFAAHGLPFTDNQLRQARLPEGGQSLPNPHGTAPGIAARLDDRWLFCLPGPPREFRPMIEQQVLPRLESARGQVADAPVFAGRVLKLFGRGEGWFADRLGDLEAEVPGLVLGYRAVMPEIQLKLRTRQADRAAAQAVLDAAERLVRERLGPLVYGSGQQSLAEVTLAALIARGQRLALAESCTGGLVGKLLTDVPGSSEAFVLSTVVYADSAKRSVLGIDAGLLAEHGAVSEACARAMAESVRRLSGADWSAAVTGIAGPGGGSPDKPVGTVWFATAGPDGTRSKLRNFPAFDRASIRTLAAHAALDFVRRRLLEEPGGGD